jgi:hypothetical protein
MAENKIYRASCHCGAVSFGFASEDITSGLRCNCSICVRKGAVMSALYYPPGAFLDMQGTEALGEYTFGDRDVVHCFCRTCGVFPFSRIASVPSTYDGPAKPGDRRINLGCVHDLDVFGLRIQTVDGRSF